MKRLILFLSLVLCGEAHSAQIANVEYIHNAIAQEWDITAPYNSKLINPRAAGTFYGCTSLTGQSAQINGKYLYNIWPSATEEQVGSAYGNATGLTDYASMPAIWIKILDLS